MPKTGRKPRRPEDQGAFFGRAGEIGGKFHTFCKEEIGEGLPKDIARI